MQQYGRFGAIFEINMAVTSGREFLGSLFYDILAGYPALLGPLPLYFSLPIRYSFLPSLPRITRLRPEYLQCNNRRG